MSLVTVLRSPSSESGSLATDSEIDEDQEDSSTSRSRASSFEGFFASKGAAYALPDGDFARRATKTGGEMQLHLQAMVNLLRDEDVLRLVVKLESQWPKRIRYLAVVSAFGPNDEEESIIMGVDWTDKATIGLVVPLYRDTNIKLDGDGGFMLTSAEKTHDLKPVSVQTMWTAFQWIHKCADNARRHNYYPTGVSHAWVTFYLKRITSDRSCLNEWNQMSDLLSKRQEPSPDSSPEKELIMKLIRHKLREVMLRVDLEEVTCRQIRTMLEEDTQMELKEYKGFIDEEMLIIMGQMDSASKIFDHLYLGSEWNASNMEELKENGVGYILNVTREIDNFFPGTFCYYNIRVYDLDETELLHHWEDTYKFIQKAKEAGSKVLVHCKMGISRSAATVIAYGMKEYGWSLGETMKYVKARRSCVQPNSGFWKQLITYEGILNSSKQRYNKLFSDRRTQSDSSDSEERSRRIRPTKKTTKKYNTIECTVPTIHDISRADHLLSEGVDSIDKVRTHNESLTSKDDASSEEIEDELIEQKGPAEDNGGDEDDVFFAATVSAEKSEMGAVSTAGTLDMSQTSLFTSGNEDVSDSTFENRSLSSGIPTLEKTSLHRVSSVPILPSAGHVRLEQLVEEQGNFKRSSSLRERGRKEIKELTLEEGKSASAENIRKSSPGGELDVQWDTGSDSVEAFARAAVENVNEPKNETEELQLEEITPIESVEMETINYAVQTETVEEPNMHGSLPRDLLGVLESGFVKRHSRNFEEGIVNLPCETETLGDNAAIEEENCYMSSDKLDQSEQVESTPGEEPEPGLVKKHKEGYEMKHRESMERTLSYKRGLSGEGESAIHEQGVEENSDAPCMPLQKDSDGQLTEAIEGDTQVLKSKTELDDPNSVPVNVEALIRKVNVDMKKEVMSRRISRTRNEQESGTPEGNAMDQVKGSPGIPMNEDLRQEAGSATEALDMQKEEGVSSEVPVTGIVKRNTLILEGKARDLVLGYVTCTETYELGGDAADSAETEQLLSDSERDRSVEPYGLFDILPGGTVRDENLKLPEEMEDNESQQDLESIPQRGLVKRHTLLIEERIQPLEQEISKAETEKEAKMIAEVTAEKNGDTSSEEEGMRYQIELASDDREDVEIGEDSEAVSGLVQREKLRIEERLQPVVVEPKQLDSEVQTTSEDTLQLESDAAVGGRSQEFDTVTQGGEVADDPDIDKETVVGVDTSSVVRVKEQTQHLESILREGQTGSTIRRQTSAEEVTKVDDTLPKIVIIPRSASMEIADSPNVDTPTSEAMETLSHSAVCLALKKAQESCESEQEPLVDWETGNVKQRTQILEEIIRDGDKENRGKSEEIKRTGSTVRRHESLPKTVCQPEKPALRRRSFSDITENSSSLKREVVYTVQQLVDSSAQSSSSSSLPKDWSPLQDKQDNMARKRAKVNEFPPDNFREPEFQEKPRFELIDCLESPRESVVSVKEKIQIIDSKNQKNIANIS